MAKRKMQSKAQKRKAATGRSKARKAAQATTVAKAKPKRPPVKKIARKMKQPIAPVVETVAVEAIEQPASGVGLDPAVGKGATQVAVMLGRQSNRRGWARAAQTDGSGAQD